MAFKHAVCTANLTGIAPVQYGRPIQTPKEQGEKDDAYEERVWKERLHSKPDGSVFLPAMSLKLLLENTAKFFSEKTKGQATWTKHFLVGIMVVDDLILNDPSTGKPIQAESVEGIRLFVPSNGQKGGAKRVYRRFPIVYEWVTSIKIIVLEPLIYSDLQQAERQNGKHKSRVEAYLKGGGQFNGFGSFAPRVGGVYGRYTVDDFKIALEA